MEVEMIEGGYLLMGCTFYMDTIHILEKGPDSCVILSKVTYQVPNEEIERKVAPYISTASLASMATAISNYVMNKRKKLLHELQVAASAKDECYWDVYSNPSDMPKLVLQLLPVVFKEMEIAKSNDGCHGVHELRIAVPPGTNNEEKLCIWSGKVISFKQCCLILMSVVSLVIVVFLSSSSRAIN
ncbi:hypothetical protein Sjap_026222 [Stephania japonica]|uniref:Uncharacterized protein n=1 Tax=Stephania japonica TaxID=461633 RepID=A0AAP0E371_9MAGN